MLPLGGAADWLYAFVIDELAIATTHHVNKEY